MRARLLAILGSLAMLLPGALRAAEPYPQAAVVFQVQVETLTKVDLSKFKSEIREQVRQAAHKYLPCLEWAPSEPGQAAAGARLLVRLLGRPYGSDLQIDLVFQGAIEQEEPVDLWTEHAVSSTLDDAWSPRNPEGLRQEVLRKVESLFKAEPFRSSLESLFIAKVPIAKSIEVNSRGQMIVVPIEAPRLKLVDPSPLVLRLAATMCHATPEYCNIELFSHGAGFGKFRDLLQCQVDSTECCKKKGWPSELPGWLATRQLETVRVYLGEKHQHCLYGYENCPDHYHNSREPGFE